MSKTPSEESLSITVENSLNGETPTRRYSFFCDIPESSRLYDVRTICCLLLAVGAVAGVIGLFTYLGSPTCDSSAINSTLKNCTLPQNPTPNWP